ncbi:MULTISPECIES: MinD/ParA family ATP-binding protein [Haloarcula]|uniref:Septum site-determining protein MinD n=4 Tax=Haloarcula TaxID=2237 RepID=A0A482T9X6_HALHI|nr:MULTISPECIES: cell division ATPase MinD [Haloarcula]AEM56056.1 cell division ATPase MinD / septum site-determining protein MinD [Haloarcula hispanica ATCC 33960]AHB64869.1 septum formation initiator [Haloarcula hispanica N601]EMA19456.1 cell division ATPase MinD/septum site-determining protein MinD [Haloarcula amylolytica JCM 13557]KAA9405320.1 septum site-determining protein MinD [Haloarcula sp. CBA1131]KAA9408790.1 septum site-determining protein MinD [Haloarcula hispanica]
MAGYVCTIAGGKGGVGKTTTAVNLGAVLQEMGYDVAVVDADLGMANLGSMLSVEPEKSLHEILAGEAAVSEALTDAPGGLTVIPGEQSLEAFADADPAKLRKVIKTLRNAYDVVLIDTGAGLSHEVAVPLGLADGIVLVTTPDDVAVGDTVKTAQLANRIDGTVLGSIINRATRHTDVAAIAEQMEFPLLAVIPDDPQATTEEPLVLNAPESTAADAYQRLTEALEGVFFRGESPETDIETILDDEWFLDDTEDHSDVDDDEDSGGVFGLFN